MQAFSVQPAMAETDIDRYAASGYSYCDAMTLGTFWKESVDDAKATIGRKIGWGNAAIVKDNIADARKQGDRCNFADTGIAYADAEAVAALCKTSVGEAKAALAEKVSMGMKSLADDVIRDAREHVQDKG